MSPEELTELQEQFKQVNHLDPEQLRAWFLDNAELTVAEHAMVMDRSKIRVDQLRQELGLNNITFIELPEGIIYSDISKQKTIPGLKPPPVGTDLWVINQYNNGSSIRALSIALGKSRVHIRTILRHRKIIKRSNKFNKYQNKEWLLEHYVNQRMSMRECGEIAGASIATIFGWLAKFKIPTRDNFEASYASMDKASSKAVSSPPSS